MRNRITIGRDTQSDIVIDDRWDTVSNEHADIMLQEGKLVFYDHSSNGTVINNQKIQNMNVGIYSGDVIMLAGKIELSWDDINRFFPRSQRPTVTRNVRAEQNTNSGRKTVQIDAPSYNSNGNKSRQTEQLVSQPFNSIRQKAQNGNDTTDNYGVENTYSQAEIDKELEKWNWGGFLCTWLWATVHKTYWPLPIIIIGCIPYIGHVCSICLHVYLGMKGSRMAWDSGIYKDFGAYKKSQRNWIIGGVIWFIVSLAVTAYIVSKVLLIL